MNLFHAVGRASSKQPALINMAYRGSPQSENWVSLIGKGVCFDAGGLDIKSTQGLKTMFLDKSGACSCLVAFQQIVKERLNINVTVTLGMV
jgi:leucyl aminopeptidase